MKKALAVPLSCLFLAVIAGVSHGGDDVRQKAEALWAGREDPARANEAVTAFESLLKETPKDYETLLRLSRLHYWIGQNLETARERESDAIAHYGKGRDYGRRAAEAAPDRPGGYFFEAASLGRENNLKGKFKSLLGIGKVEELNRKAESIQPDYFYQGPDRFFCAYYTRLPGLLGGASRRPSSTEKRRSRRFRTTPGTGSSSPRRT